MLRSSLFNASFSGSESEQERASKELAPKLQAYEAVIRETIGARAQQKMTREQALFVATCSSGHRDISLSA